MPIQFSNANTHSPVFDNLVFMNHPNHPSYIHFRYSPQPPYAWLCHPGLKQVIPRGHFSPQIASAV